MPRYRILLHYRQLYKLREASSSHLPTTASRKRGATGISVDEILEDVAELEEAARPKRASVRELPVSEVPSSSKKARRRVNGKFARTIGPTKKDLLTDLRGKRKEVLTALRVKRLERKQRKGVKRGTITALRTASKELLARIRSARGFVPSASSRRPPPPRRRSG